MGGDGYGNGLLAVGWLWSPTIPPQALDIERQQVWPDVISLPIPLLLLVAGLSSKRPRFASAIRIARLLAAALLIGVAVGNWLFISFDDGYVVPVRERIANAVRLLAFDYPLVPLLVVLGVWEAAGRRALAASFAVVLTSYAASMCLDVQGTLKAVFGPTNFDWVQYDYESWAQTGVAAACKSLAYWLQTGIRPSDPEFPLHTTLLIWASVAGAIIAAASGWSRRAWLRRIGAAAATPAAILCVPGRSIIWFASFTIG